MNQPCPWSVRMVLYSVALVSLLLPASASGFTLQSPVSAGCHERITLEALRQSGGAVPEWPLSRDDALLAEGLPFSLPPQARTPFALALLIGVRDNDLRGLATTDLRSLAALHSASDGQREHCLRASADDGQEGDSAALAACREFIHAEVAAALGDGAAADPMEQELVSVALSFRGSTQALLSRQAFHLGRALHALQDSFTHTLRSRDGKMVHHVFNYVDALRRGYEPEADGEPHQSHFDSCDAGDPATERRVRWAREASAALMGALLDERGTSEQRLARSAEIIDGHLSVEAGCSRQNDYCGAADAAMMADSGCSVARGAGSTPSVAAILLLLCMTAVLRRRAARALLLAAVVLAATGGRASAAAPHGLGIQATVAASVDGGALAGSVALRWEASRRIALGLDAEYNPWLSLESARIAPGTVNGYATLIIYLKRMPKLDLRMTGHLGASVLLFDTPGAQIGSVGPYAGLSVLGISIPLRPSVKLIIDPADIALSMPQVHGVPLLYKQYRFSIGIQWGT